MPQLPVLNGNTNTSVGKRKKKKKAVKPLTQLIHPLWEAAALTQLPEKSTEQRKTIGGVLKATSSSEVEDYDLCSVVAKGSKVASRGESLRKRLRKVNLLAEQC